MLTGICWLGVTMAPSRCYAMAEAEDNKRCLHFTCTSTLWACNSCLAVSCCWLSRACIRAEWPCSNTRPLYQQHLWQIISVFAMQSINKPLCQCKPDQRLLESIVRQHVHDLQQKQAWEESGPMILCWCYKKFCTNLTITIPLCSKTCNLPDTQAFKQWWRGIRPASLHTLCMFTWYITNASPLCIMSKCNACFALRTGSVWQIPVIDDECMAP